MGNANSSSDYLNPKGRTGGTGKIFPALQQTTKPQGVGGSKMSRSEFYNDSIEKQQAAETMHGRGFNGGSILDKKAEADWNYYNATKNMKKFTQ